MRLAYADPPYPGSAYEYRGHADYAGEVDHGELVARLADYDGWILHTASTRLAAVLPLCPADARIGAWVKPFASFKPGIQVAYAWEPVIFRPARRDRSRTQSTIMDWLACPITLQKGLVGAKPPEVIRWTFGIVGADPLDELDDLYPGTGVVGRTWDSWRTWTPIRDAPAPRVTPDPLFEAEP